MPTPAPIQAIFDFQHEVATKIVAEKMSYASAVKSTAEAWDREQPHRLAWVTNAQLDGDYVRAATSMYEDHGYRLDIEDAAKDLARFGCFRDDHIAVLDDLAERRHEGSSALFGFDVREELPTVAQFEKVVNDPKFNEIVNAHSGDVKAQLSALVDHSMGETQVTLYAQPNCGGCKFTESFLSRNNVEFTHVDVSVNETAAHMLRDRGYRSTPVVIVERGGHIVEEWSGLNQAKLKSLARSEGRPSPRAEVTDFRVPKVNLAR